MTRRDIVAPWKIHLSLCTWGTLVPPSFALELQLTRTGEKKEGGDLSYAVFVPVTGVGDGGCGGCHGCHGCHGCDGNGGSQGSERARERERERAGEQHAREKKTPWKTLPWKNLRKIHQNSLSWLKPGHTEASVQRVMSPCARTNGKYSTCATGCAVRGVQNVAANILGVSQDLIEMR